MTGMGQKEGLDLLLNFSTLSGSYQDYNLAGAQGHRAQSSHAKGVPGDHAGNSSQGHPGTPNVRAGQTQQTWMRVSPL